MQTQKQQTQQNKITIISQFAHWMAQSSMADALMIADDITEGDFTCVNEEYTLWLEFECVTEQNYITKTQWMEQAHQWARAMNGNPLCA